MKWQAKKKQKMTETHLRDDAFVVITGAAGFIGSGLVRKLNDLGLTHLVVVDWFDDETKWKNLNGKQVAEHVSPFELFEWLKGRAEDIQAVVHLGAISDTLEMDVDHLIENNYRYSVDLAEYCLTHDIRFVYASSAATYGDGSQGFSDDSDKVKDLRPLNPYGFSKQLFDQWALIQGGLQTIAGIKYFNIFGPNEWHKGRMASPIPKMVKTVQEEGVIRLFKSNHPDYKDGMQKRDFLYVKEAVEMTYQILASNRAGLYNVGSGQATPWNDLASYVFEALDQKKHIEYIDMPETLSSQYQNYTCADMSRFESHFEHRPAPLRDSVFDYVQKHLVPQHYW